MSIVQQIHMNCSTREVLHVNKMNNCLINEVAPCLIEQWTKAIVNIFGGSTADTAARRSSEVPPPVPEVAPVAADGPAEGAELGAPLPLAERSVLAAFPDCVFVHK